MKFEDLKLIFNTSNYIELACDEIIPKTIKNQLIRFDKNNRSNSLLIRTIDNSTEFNALSYLCKTINDKDNAMIDKVLYTPYFAKVVFVEKEKVGIDIVSVNNIEKFDIKFDIGISDKALGNSRSFSSFESNFNTDFCFKVANKKYYVFGKHIHNNTKQFSIVSNNGLVDVLQKQKKDCGVSIEGNENDEIFIIDSPIKQYDESNYRFYIAEADISFDDITTTNSIAKQNAAFINSDLEKYVSNWRVYCNLEYKYVTEKHDEAGVLLYSAKQESADEVEFIINNAEKVEKFLTILGELRNPQNQVDDILVEGNVQFRGKDKLAKVTLRYKERKDDKFICYKNRDHEIEIPRNGSISISIIGYEVQYERRLTAIDRILKSKSAKPNLAMLLSGTGVVMTNRTTISPWSMDIKKLFGGNKPTDKQIDAIRIALNTPDIAIIQGPPGTGKTKVINAIQQRISEEERDKTMTFGKNLMTAYQKEATKNLSKDMRIYGLPTVSVLGGNKFENKPIEDEFKIWLTEKVNEIEIENSSIAVNVGKRKSRENFYNIQVRYNPEKYSYEKDLSELKLLKATVGDEIIGAYLLEIDDLIDEASEQLKKLNVNVMPYEINIVKNIPTSKISYSDDGEKLVKRIFYYLSDEKELAIPILELKKLFAESEIDFERVKTLKNEILAIMQPKNTLIIPKRFNEKIVNLLQEINDGIEKVDETDEEKILSDYVDAFKNNPFQIRSAIDKFMTVIAATHQKTLDKDIMEKKYVAKMDEVVYDNVLVDEAARSCPPDLLIPMCCAKDRIILVGDHKQLPQLISDEIYDKIDKETMSVEDKEALKETMFERLIEEAKKLKAIDGFERFITLDTQYRMHPILGDFISRNFYEKDGVKIKSGLSATQFAHSLPGIENKAMVWMDVQGKSGDYEHREDGGGYCRKIEADKIAEYICKVLKTESCNFLTIGIMSFYRKQIREIYKSLFEKQICKEDNNGRYVIKDEYKYITREDGTKIERFTIDTVDAFQGLEKDLVILSMTRSNKPYKNKKDHFGFLKSENRLCVALSRQKKCLIIAGDSNMVKIDKAEDSISALCDFYKICKKGGDEVAII